MAQSTTIPYRHQLQVALCNPRRTSALEADLLEYHPFYYGTCFLGGSLFFRRPGVFFPSGVRF